MFKLYLFVLCFSVVNSYWKPNPSDTFHIQFAGTLNIHHSAHVYDVDLFETPTSTIKYLHDHGKKVVCYFSAGTFEHDGHGKNIRPDHPSFPHDAIGHALGDWPTEQYIDIRNSVVRTIMTNRLVLAHSKGCDGIDADNVDAYEANNGFHLKASDQLNYNKWIAHEANNHGLSIGLKNAVELIRDLEPFFDFAINEQCMTSPESCNKYLPFINHQKAVFHLEYVDHISQGQSKQTTVCSQRPHQFVTLIKLEDLSDWSLSC